MKEVKDFVFDENKKNKYDWDTILNGSTWRLEKGKDFKSATKSMLALVKMTAKSRNINVKAQIDGDDLVLKAEGV